MPISGAGINTLAFVGNRCAFAKSGRGGTVAEHKRDDLEEKKLKRAKDKLNLIRLDFIDKMLHQENETKAYISNVDGAMLEYCRLFAKGVKLLSPEPQLPDFYHPS